MVNLMMIIVKIWMDNKKMNPFPKITFRKK